MSSSILLITPFFGPCPKWTPAFLESGRLNADIGWIFFGNKPFHWETTPNVQFQQMGLCDLLAQAKAATGFDVQKENYSQSACVSRACSFLRVLSYAEISHRAAAIGFLDRLLDCGPIDRYHKLVYGGS